MKAIVYTKYGPPEVLHVAEREKPTPRDDEVRIRIHAVEATKADCELRSFRFPVKWFWLPLRIGLGIRGPRNPVLGSYFAGEIEAVGAAVSKFKKGDAVFGAAGLRMGAYGEYVCLPARCTIVPKPHNLTYEEAAAVPLGALNAIHFLRKASIKKGETVLINGAGGSIGMFGVQIAKAMGAEVTGVDSPIKGGLVRRLGADYFIDYTKEDFTKSGHAYDVILDMVVKSSYSACIRALKPGGRYLIGNPRVSDMLRAVVTNRFTDKTTVVAMARETEEELLALKDMIEAEKIRPVIDGVYAMDQAAEAHRRVETEQRLGMVVIAVLNSTDA